MLKEKKLKDGLKKAAEKNEQTFEKLDQKIQKLKSDIGQSLTHKQFQQMAQQMKENETQGMKDKTAERMGKALAKYLNGMEDMTGDGLMKPFTKKQTKPIFDAMMQIQNIGVPAADAKIQQTWLGFFPLQFKLTTPPSGSIRKTSSIGSPVPLQSIVPAVTKNKSFDEFVSKLAGIIHTSASKIPVTINHIIPSPSGPTPGPPIPGIVK